MRPVRPLFGSRPAPAQGWPARFPRRWRRWRHWAARCWAPDASVGAVARFAGTWGARHDPAWYGGQIARQFFTIGFLSLPVVGMTTWFTGAALALNIYSGATASIPKPCCRRSSRWGLPASWGRCWRR